MRPQRRTKAIGYVRVSSEQQVHEGVSLDAQRRKLRDYCRAMDIELIDIISDAGYSASNLKRPGLQAALSLLQRDKADALIVVKLDRLTRCVKDLGTLCEQYFSDSKKSTLLAVSDSIDTRTAAGKLVLNVLTSVAQWEREAISERTRDSLAHLKSEGVQLGGAPYGWRYSTELDAHGRRRLVKTPDEQRTIRRICKLHDQAVPIATICERLAADGYKARGPRWQKRTVQSILERVGYKAADRPQNDPPTNREPREIQRDKRATGERALQLRGQALSLREVGARLRREGYMPPRGGQWHAATVMDLMIHARLRVGNKTHGTKGPIGGTVRGTRKGRYNTARSPRAVGIVL